MTGRVWIARSTYIPRYRISSFSLLKIVGCACAWEKPSSK
jgi:hypothetical protein